MSFLTRTSLYTSQGTVVLQFISDLLHHGGWGVNEWRSIGIFRISMTTTLDMFSKTLDDESVMIQR